MTIKTATATSRANAEKDFNTSWDHLTKLFSDFEVEQASIINLKSETSVVKAWTNNKGNASMKNAPKKNPAWTLKFPIHTENENLDYILELKGSSSTLKLKASLSMMETLKSALDGLV